MTFEQADNGRSNTAKDKSNCAACVLTHELRLRGFDITAKPYSNKTNSISEQLAADTRLAWLDAKGKRPQYTAHITGTEKEIKNKINKLTATIGSRYNISWDINDYIGHIVTMERTELLRIDTLLVNPQLLQHLAAPLE